MNLINTTSNVSQSNQTIIINYFNFNWDSLFQIITDHPLAIILVILGIVILLFMEHFASVLGMIYFALTRFFTEKEKKEKENNRKKFKIDNDEPGTVIDAEYSVINHESSHKK